MTDIERLAALLTDFGVGFERKTDPDTGLETIDCTVGSEHERAVSKIHGYADFSASFIFSSCGQFSKMRIWE